MNPKARRDLSDLLAFYVLVFFSFLLPWVLIVLFWFGYLIAVICQPIVTATRRAWRTDPWFRGFVAYLFGAARPLR